MKFDTNKTITTTLVLNEEEREWLHGVMQNPLWGQLPTEESPLDQHHRKALFNATKGLQEEE